MFGKFFIYKNLEKKCLCMMIFMFIVAISYATIINIPTEYSNIQEGINAASTYDTVLVDTGTYVENINFNGKNITVASLFLTTQDTSYITQTIIDGDNNGSVALFENGEDTTAVISGFHLQNGSGTSYTNPSGYTHIYGGGIFCNFSSSPKIGNLKISNGTTEFGGGICAYNASIPRIDNVEIYNCHADKGGAIYFNIDGSAIIKNSFFHHNTGRRGAAIYFREDTLIEPFIDNCVFSENSATQRAGALGTFNTNMTIRNTIFKDNFADLGGALFIWLKNITMQNVLFYNNSSTSDGGAIFSCQCNPCFINTCFYDNSSAEMGGGFYGWSSSTPYFINSILWGNTPQQIHCRDTGNPNTVTVRYSCLEGGEAGISTVNTTVNWLEGNIDTDPLYNPLTFQLTEESPCIDAGTPDTTGLNLPLLDLDGNDRIIDGDDDGIAIIDMGAYEYEGPPFAVEDYEFQENNILSYYPNPVHFTDKKITLQFSLPKPAMVKISLFNLKGQCVENIINESKNIGEYTINHQMNKISTGIYFLKLKIDGVDKEVKKLLVLK